ncbi:MAG: hypothetical protein A2Y15_02370 [Clostridiales bacterium GWF2_36_10]|nr:MAG: hypothetical protein A2Y15_02370 [Clostridiales bacterium GWF2_36_10]HAN21258.1 hypothetical protein [Clostridiales bacterium]
MRSQYEQLTLFLDSINDEARKSTEKIMNIADEFRSNELEKAKLEAAQKSRNYIKYESDKLKTQSNRKVSEANKELRKQLIEKRNSIAEAVFNEVTEKLHNFMKTDDYKSFLLSSIKKFAEYYKEAHFTVYMKIEDMKYKEFLMDSIKTIGRVEEDSDIIIGGCKAKCDNINSELDDTLDSRLESEKEWFYENSGLAI